jgi:putative effector of murein hydrolase
MIKVMLVMLGASVCFVLGVARLLLTDSISLLGVTASCGNPLAYLMGSDNAHALGLSVCRGSLRNGAIEGIALILLAVIFCIFAFVLFMSSALKRRPNSADPGEFSW